MPTYAGYQAISTPDLSAPFREQMSGLMNKRALEAQQASEIAREQLKLQKAADDKFEADHLANMQSIYEGAKFDNPIKGLDERVFQGVRSGADGLAELAKMKRQGLISDRDYNLNALNRKTSISNIGKIYENIEQVSTKQSERIADGKAGWRERERAAYNAELFNLENHQIGWLSDGNATWQTINPEGDVVGEMPIINMASANSMENQFTEKIDLEKVASEVAKQPQDYTYSSGSRTITDLRKKEGYTDWLRNNIDTITNGDDDSRLVDLLMDNNISTTVKLDNGKETEIFGSGIRDYDQIGNLYFNALKEAEAAKGSQLTEDEAERIEKEVKNMTFTIIEKGGKDTYSMSLYAKKRVRESIQERIEFNLGYKETKSGDGGGNGGDAKLSSGARNIYPITKAAFDDKDFSGLSDNYHYVWSEDGIKVYNITSSSGVKVSPQLVIDATADRKGSVKADDGSDVIIAPVVVKTPKQLSKYAYGGGTSGGASAYDKWDESYKYHTGGEYKSTEHEMKKPSVYDAINRTSRFSLPGEYTPSRNTSNTGEAELD